jgi:hypothetical protein
MSDDHSISSESEVAGTGNLRQRVETLKEKTADLASSLEHVEKTLDEAAAEESPRH